MSRTYCGCGGKRELECTMCGRDYCKKCVREKVVECMSCWEDICKYECTLTRGDPLGPNECCLCLKTFCDYCLNHVSNHQTEEDCKICDTCKQTCRCSVALCEVCFENGICCECGAKIPKPKVDRINKLQHK